MTSKTAYAYDPDTKLFTGSFDVEERPEFTMADMDKGVEFDDISAPTISDGQRARWDGTKYIIENQYPDLLNATWTAGSDGQYWNGTAWQDETPSS